MNGDGYITNWRLCRGNPADVGMLEEVVEEHAERFGEEFLAGAMDRGYYDGEKIGKLEETHGICLAIQRSPPWNAPSSPIRCCKQDYPPGQSVGCL